MSRYVYLPLTQNLRGLEEEEEEEWNQPRQAPRKTLNRQCPRIFTAHSHYTEDFSETVRPVLPLPRAHHLATLPTPFILRAVCGIGLLDKHDLPVV